MKHVLALVLVGSFLGAFFAVVGIVAASSYSTVCLCKHRWDFVQGRCVPDPGRPKIK